MRGSSRGCGGAAGCALSLVHAVPHDRAPAPTGLSPDAPLGPVPLSFMPPPPHTPAAPLPLNSLPSLGGPNASMLGPPGLLWAQQQQQQQLMAMAAQQSQGACTGRKCARGPKGMQGSYV